MKRRLTSGWRESTALALTLAALLGAAGAANAGDTAALRDKWCSKVHLRFFVGGAEGDAFGTIGDEAGQAAYFTGGEQTQKFFRKMMAG